MRRLLTFLGLLMIIATATPAAAQTPAASTPGATPTAIVHLATLLPTGDEVPAGLEMTQDGERTLDDVLSGFPDEAAERFAAWGWRGNVVRAFHTPAGADVSPGAVDGVYVSIHAFATPDDAGDALAYIVDTHKRQDPAVVEQGHLGLGDESRVLWGEQPYGSEVTLYVRAGSVVIRLSANAPDGDPSEVAWGLIDVILSRPALDR
jgi:hypothetical protein